jgi:hypothetical protein
MAPQPIYAGTPPIALCSREACPHWQGQTTLFETSLTLISMSCDLLGYAPENSCPVVEPPPAPADGDLWMQLLEAQELEERRRAAAGSRQMRVEQAESRPLYALTLWQPWADLIVDGIKPVENRPWPPPRWLIGQRFAIHAGRTYDTECAEECAAGSFSEDRSPIIVKSKAEITLGAIVGVATLERYNKKASLFRSADESPWFFGPFGWWLRDVIRIDPVPCRGKQKLWRVEGETLEAVVSAVRTQSGLAGQVREVKG